MLDECVEAVGWLRNENSVNLLGVCQGGTFSLCYTAVHSKKVRNLIAMVTPVDFHTEDNTLFQWVRKVDLDALVGCYGNVPGHASQWAVCLPAAVSPWIEKIYRSR